MDRRSVSKSSFSILIKVLLATYILTAGMLAVLTCLFFSFGLNERAVRAGIIIIYIAVTFLAGLILGKRMESRKYLWGLGIGALYYCILFLLSMVIGENGIASTGTALTTLLLCLGGGMLGGMMG